MTTGQTARREHIVIDSDDDDDLPTIKATRTVKRKLLTSPEHEDSPVMKKKPRLSLNEVSVQIVDDVHNEPVGNKHRNLPGIYHQQYQDFLHEGGDYLAKSLTCPSVLASVKTSEEVNIPAQLQPSKGTRSAPRTGIHDQGRELDGMVPPKDGIKPLSMITGGKSATGAPLNVSSFQNCLEFLTKFHSSSRKTLRKRRRLRRLCGKWMTSQKRLRCFSLLILI
jgi:hypothetical protein